MFATVQLFLLVKTISSSAVTFTFNIKVLYLPLRLQSSHTLGHVQMLQLGLALNIH